VDKAVATQLANIEKRTGKVKVTNPAEVDAELIAWIRRAFEGAA
jgi:hypothetical protein